MCHLCLLAFVARMGCSAQIVGHPSNRGAVLAVRARCPAAGRSGRGAGNLVLTEVIFGRLRRRYRSVAQGKGIRCLETPRVSWLVGSYVRGPQQGEQSASVLAEAPQIAHGNDGGLSHVATHKSKASKPCRPRPANEEPQRLMVETPGAARTLPPLMSARGRLTPAKAACR